MTSCFGWLASSPVVCVAMICLDEGLQWLPRTECAGEIQIDSAHAERHLRFAIRSPLPAKPAPPSASFWRKRPSSMTIDFTSSANHTIDPRKAPRQTRRQPECHTLHHRQHYLHTSREHGDATTHRREPFLPSHRTGQRKDISANQNHTAPRIARETRPRWVGEAENTRREAGGELGIVAGSESAGHFPCHSPA